jgi:hypothetical protein
VQKEAPASILRAQSVVQDRASYIPALSCCLRCPGAAPHHDPFFGRGTQVRQAEMRYHNFLFTVNTHIILILTLQPLFISHRCAGVWAVRPSRGSQGWVAAPPTPHRRAVLLFGPTRAQRSSGDSEIGRRSGQDVVYISSPPLGAQDRKAAMQWGLAMQWAPYAVGQVNLCRY